MSYFSCVWRYLNASLLGSALYNREEKKKEEEKKKAALKDRSLNNCKHLLGVCHLCLHLITSLCWNLNCLD